MLSVMCKEGDIEVDFVLLFVTGIHLSENLKYIGNEYEFEFISQLYKF